MYRAPKNQRLAGTAKQTKEMSYRDPRQSLPEYSTCRSSQTREALRKKLSGGRVHIV